MFVLFFTAQMNKVLLTCLCVVGGFIGFFIIMLIIVAVERAIQKKQETTFVELHPVKNAKKSAEKLKTLNFDNQEQAEKYINDIYAKINALKFDKMKNYMRFIKDVGDDSGLITLKTYGLMLLSDSDDEKISKYAMKELNHWFSNQFYQYDKLVSELAGIKYLASTNSLNVAGLSDQSSLVNLCSPDHFKDVVKFD